MQPSTAAPVAFELPGIGGLRVAVLRCDAGLLLAEHDSTVDARKIVTGICSTTDSQK